MNVLVTSFIMLMATQFMPMKPELSDERVRNVALEIFGADLVFENAWGRGDDDYSFYSFKYVTVPIESIAGLCQRLIVHVSAFEKDGRVLVENVKQRKEYALFEEAGICTKEMNWIDVDVPPPSGGVPKFFIEQFSQLAADIGSEGFCAKYVGDNPEVCSELETKFFGNGPFRLVSITFTRNLELGVEAFFISLDSGKGYAHYFLYVNWDTTKLGLPFNWESSKIVKAEATEGANI